MPIPHPPRQVLLWTDDGAGKFSASVTLSQALCDGQWHQLAGEPGPSAWPDVPGGPTDPASVECLRGTWGGSFGPSGRGPLAKQRGWPPALVRGPAQLSHQSLCPTVTKSGNVLRLEVDAQSNQTLGPTRAISAYTLVPLHLGGLPGECGLSLVRGGLPLRDWELGSPSSQPSLLWWGARWKLVSALAISPPLPLHPQTHSLGTLP